MAEPSIGSNIAPSAHPFVFSSADMILLSSDSADMILLSSDGRKFFVHKNILSVASPFFETMFSLPQAPSPDLCPTDEHNQLVSRNHDGLPVIHITEHGSIIEPLLRFCYPIDDPILTDPHVIRRVLEAAMKYEFSEALQLMKDRLVVLAKTMPLRIYAIACADRLEDVARAAALEVRTSRQFKKYVDELEEIRAGAYYRLLAYCEKPGPAPVDQVFCDPPAI